MYVHSLHCLTQTALKDVAIFPRVVISHLYIRNETYEVIIINLLITASFSISKRLCKGIGKRESDTCAVTYNRCMLQNEATFFLLLS
jgi:hypothetical protein